MAIVVNGKKVAGLGLPGKSAYQAAVDGGYTGNEQEFNTALAGMRGSPFLPLAGGTMKPNAIIQGTDNLGIISPQNIQIGTESATFAIIGGTVSVEAGAAKVSFSAPLDMNGYQIKELSSPVDSTDAANKQYVDGLIGDINTALDAINGEVV